MCQFFVALLDLEMSLNFKARFLFRAESITERIVFSVNSICYINFIIKEHKHFSIKKVEGPIMHPPRKILSNKTLVGLNFLY